MRKAGNSPKAQGSRLDKTVTGGSLLSGPVSKEAAGTVVVCCQTGYQFGPVRDFLPIGFDSDGKLSRPAVQARQHNRQGPGDSLSGQ